MALSISSVPVRDVTSDTLKAFSTEAREPAWAAELRLAALANYQALPWPGPRDEKWKRLGLDAMPWEKFSTGFSSITAASSAAQLPPELKAFETHESANGNTPGRFYSHLGSSSYVAMPETLRASGVEWVTFLDAMQKYPDRVRSAWKEAIERAKDNKFFSLTLALANGGACLFVPKNVQVKTPLLSYVSDSAARDAQFPLNFIFIDAGSEAQVWEELLGDENAASDTPSFVSSYTGIQLAENAQASFYYLQHWSRRTSHFQFLDVAQAAHSKLQAVAVSVGGKVSHNETTIHLKGENAENKVLGLLFGDGDQNFENFVTQNHTARKTVSDIQYRGALKGTAQSFFSGMVYINKDAQQSDAFQAAKSLLLSEGARADAIPNLEILADDVKCAHGAAVGPVDEDQKFYLQTRGVPPLQAEEIIVEGFFDPVITQVPSESVQDRLRAFVERKLHAS